MASGGHARRRGTVAIRPEALRAARQARVMTQREVAQGIITEQALAAWETGRNRPTMANLRPVCERLGIPVRAVLAERRDPREAELAKLESEQRFAELGRLATEILDDFNVRRESQAVAWYYHGRAVVTESPEQGLRELRRAYTLLVKVGLKGLAAQALDWQAIALYYMEDPGALAVARRALEMYRSQPDQEPAVESRMHEHIGTVLLQRWENEEAINSYREALAGAVDIGRLGIIYHGLSSGYNRVGDPRRALEYIERAVSLFRTRDEIRGVLGDANTARAESACATLLLKFGDAARAEAMIEASLDHFKQARVESGLADSLLTMGELHMRQGRLSEAMDWTERAIALAERMEAPISISEGYQQLGELLSRQGERDRFEAAFSRAIEVLGGVRDRQAKVLARYRQLTEGVAEQSRQA